MACGPRWSRTSEARSSIGDAEIHPYGTSLSVALKKPRPPFRLKGNERVAVNLADWERALLASLPAQLRELLTTDDPSLRRLFPVAYLGDDERNDEYQRLMRDELLSSRMAAADILEAHAHDTEISTGDLAQWMNTANSIRLVIGTQLDVGEEELEIDDEGDPRAAAYQVYGWLGYLVENAVRALSGEPSVDW